MKTALLSKMLYGGGDSCGPLPLIRFTLYLKVSSSQAGEN